MKDHDDRKAIAELYAHIREVNLKVESVNDKVSEIHSEVKIVTSSVEKISLYLLGDQAITGLIDEVKELKKPKSKVKPAIIVTSITGVLVGLIELIKTYLK